MQTVIRIKRLKKDGSVDHDDLMSVVEHLLHGRSVVMPVDGIYGISRIPSADTCSSDAEYLVDEFGVLEKWARYNKADYDFLKRVWPDEVTVLMHSRNGSSDPVKMRMPQSVVSKAIVSLSGGTLEFFPLLNPKGKPHYKKSEIECLAKVNEHTIFFIDEWCKSHPLPTVIDIRNGALKLVRSGRVAIDDLSSLFFLGTNGDEA